MQVGKLIYGNSSQPGYFSLPVIMIIRHAGNANLLIRNIYLVYFTSPMPRFAGHDKDLTQLHQDKVIDFAKLVISHSFRFCLKLLKKLFFQDDADI